MRTDVTIGPSRALRRAGAVPFTLPAGWQPRTDVRQLVLGPPEEKQRVMLRIARLDSRRRSYVTRRSCGGRRLRQAGRRTARANAPPGRPSEDPELVGVSR